MFDERRTLVFRLLVGRHGSNGRLYVHNLDLDQHQWHKTIHADTANTTALSRYDGPTNDSRNQREEHGSHHWTRSMNQKRDMTAPQRNNQEERRKSDMNTYLNRDWTHLIVHNVHVDILHIG
jgi:hypothetical protein